MSKDEVNRRKAAWTPEKRAALSAYKKAHPAGNRSAEWWAANPQFKAEQLARMEAGRERKRQEREAAAAEAGGDRGDGS